MALVNPADSHTKYSSTDCAVYCRAELSEGADRENKPKPLSPVRANIKLCPSVADRQNDELPTDRVGEYLDFILINPREQVRFKHLGWRAERGHGTGVKNQHPICIRCGQPDVVQHNKYRSARNMGVIPRGTQHEFLMSQIEGRGWLI